MDAEKGVEVGESVEARWTRPEDRQVQGSPRLMAWEADMYCSQEGHRAPL